jgi:hypothetical protein
MGGALRPILRFATLALRSPDGAISVVTRVFDALRRNPGFVSRGTTAPHCAEPPCGLRAPPQSAPVCPGSGAPLIRDGPIMEASHCLTVPGLPGTREGRTSGLRREGSDSRPRRSATRHLAIVPQFRPRCSAVRQASACAVSVGLCAPLVPITEAPRMPRFGTSCAKP